jgi:hypothetical protein
MRGAVRALARFLLLSGIGAPVRPRHTGERGNFTRPPRSMIWPAALVHLNARTLAFQTLIQSSSAVMSPSSEQNTWTSYFDLKKSPG